MRLKEEGGASSLGERGKGESGGKLFEAERSIEEPTVSWCVEHLATVDLQLVGRRQ